MNESAATNLTERQRYWLEQVLACEASGKSIAEYAPDQGIDAKAMYAGKKALVKKGVLPRTRPAPFQRAQVVDPLWIASGTSSCRMVYRSRFPVRWMPAH